MIPTALLRDAASVEVHRGDGAYGPHFDAPLTVACRLEPRKRLTRSGDGITVEAVGRLFCRSDVVVTPQSRVTLAGIAYTVLSAATQPGLSGPSHQELELGLSEAES